jgi:hypothetical protein
MYFTYLWITFHNRVVFLSVLVNIVKIKMTLAIHMLHTS